MSDISWLVRPFISFAGADAGSSDFADQGFIGNTTATGPNSRPTNFTAYGNFNPQTGNLDAYPHANSRPGAACGSVGGDAVGHCGRV